VKGFLIRVPKLKILRNICGTKIERNVSIEKYSNKRPNTHEVKPLRKEYLSLKHFPKLDV